MSVRADEFGARFADVYCLPAVPAAMLAATIESYVALGVSSLRLVAWQPHSGVALHAELIARLRAATARRRAG